MQTNIRERRNNKNPYLDEFLSIYGEKYPITFGYPIKLHLEGLQNQYNGYLERGRLTRRYSFAIPDLNAIQIINKYSPIVEIGAGTGYWAYLLSHYGCDIIAYDNKSEEERWTHKHFIVSKGDENCISNHPERTLFVCWPRDALPIIKNYKGEYFIYIGEGIGGCTGGDEFFEFLDENFELIQSYRIPQWPGIHDNLEVYKRKH